MEAYILDLRLCPVSILFACWVIPSSCQGLCQAFHSEQCLGNHLGCQESNLSELCARKTPYLPYYLLSIHPVSNIRIFFLSTAFSALPKCFHFHSAQLNFKMLLWYLHTNLLYHWILSLTQIFFPKFYFKIYSLINGLLTVFGFQVSGDFSVIFLLLISSVIPLNLFCDLCHSLS